MQRTDKSCTFTSVHVSCKTELSALVRVWIVHASALWSSCVWECSTSRFVTLHVGRAREAWHLTLLVEIELRLDRVSLLPCSGLLHQCNYRLFGSWRQLCSVPWASYFNCSAVLNKIWARLLFSGQTDATRALVCCHSPRSSSAPHLRLCAQRCRSHGVVGKSLCD